MKNAVVLLLLVFVTGCLPKYSQSITANKQDNNDAHLPKVKYAHRPTEGLRTKMPIDTVTALDTLIHRLNGKWEFFDTDKFYKIGYTYDMYSIAAYGEAAIEPLMQFSKGLATPRGELGVVYTLHLIGINSVDAGPFQEKFTSKQARQALLSLLADPDLSGTIVHLLMRDPRQSDVPVLFAKLQHPFYFDWVLVNAMKYYNLPKLPIGQSIPTKLGEVSFKYPRVKHLNLEQRQAAAARGELSPEDAQILGILKAVRALKMPAVQVEDSLLLARKFWGHWSTEFGCQNCTGVGGKELMIKTFLETMHESRVQYFISDKRLQICTPSSARRRLLSWWEAQPPAFKSRFIQDKAKKSPTDITRWGF